MHTPQEKKARRAKWVNEVYQHETKGKRFEDGYSRIERTKGKMYTLGGIVQLYGGWTWQPAVEGAVRTASKCALLGGQWHEVDEWSGLAFYFVLSKEIVISI